MSQGRSIRFSRKKTLSLSFRFSSDLDAESQNVYLLNLVINTNPSLPGWAAITLMDENNKIPTFSITSLNINIPNNRIGVQTIAQIPAFDRDLTSPNNFVQYRMNQNLNDAIILSRFFVSSDGTIWTNFTFDQQNRSSYSMIITAFDGAPAWSLTSNEQNNTQNFQLNVFIVGGNYYPPGLLSIDKDKYQHLS